MLVDGLMLHDTTSSSLGEQNLSKNFQMSLSRFRDLCIQSSQAVCILFYLMSFAFREGFGSYVALLVRSLRATIK